MQIILRIYKFLRGNIDEICDVMFDEGERYEGIIFTRFKKHKS